jgi:hypothetical protein
MVAAAAPKKKLRRCWSMFSMVLVIGVSRAVAGIDPAASAWPKGYAEAAGTARYAL